MQEAAAPRVLNLRPGEWVEVGEADAILRTLDDAGCVDGLPFMPEMLRYCGQRLRVFRRADKTCDTIVDYTSRRMMHAVHLEGLRCDGGHHGGCQAGCLLFWKEVWLRRATGDSPGGGGEHPVPAVSLLDALTTAPDQQAPGETVFVCQATEMSRATTPLRWWDPRPYLRELRSGNVSLATFARTLGLAWYNAVQRRIGGLEYPRVPLPRDDVPRRWWDPRPYVMQLRWGKVPLGTFVRAVAAAWRRATANNEPSPQAAPAVPPARPLNLQRGERARVRSLDAIAATLTAKQRHKGLWFDVEMIPYCGGEYRVLQRVERVINDRTGKMLEMKNDCLILEGVACQGCLSRNRLFCPRSLYPFWREAWLERVK